MHAATQTCSFTRASVHAATQTCTLQKLVHTAYEWFGVLRARHSITYLWQYSGLYSSETSFARSQFVVPGQDINLCYLSMAVKLQHIYRAVVPEFASQDGPMRVNSGKHDVTCA